MPHALTSNWPAIKATAIACNSLQEAATAHNISYNAVRMRASREKWPVGIRLNKLKREMNEQVEAQVSKTATPKGSIKAVTVVTDTSEALESMLVKGKQRFQLATSMAVAKAAEHAASLAGDQILKKARAVKDITDAGAKLHGLDKSGGDKLNVQILNLRFT